MKITYKISDINITAPSEELLKTSKIFERLGQIGNEGRKATLTDFAIITGGWCGPYDIKYPKDRAAGYYTSSKDLICGYTAVNVYGELAPASTRINDCTIRPVLYLPDKLFEEVIKNKKEGENGIFEVEFGKYPQYAPSPKIQKKLNTKLNELHTLKISDGYYTYIDKSNMNINGYVPEFIDEDGKKYTTKKLDLYFTSPMETLSNGTTYPNKEYVWIEVEPIVWLIDEKNKALISKRGLISGIRIDDPEQISDNFEETEMASFMNNFMLPDMLKGESLTVNSSFTQKEELKEIDELKKEILSYAPYYQGKENINEVINDIISEYNNKLDLLKESIKSKTINLELQSEEVLYTNLIIKLNNILNKLKTYFENNKKYLDMIAIINASRHLLEEDNLATELDDEFVKDIKTISKDILPFLDEKEKDKIKKELISVLDKYSKEILAYLDSLLIFSSNTTIKELPYHEADEFELLLRREIHPILKDLSFLVDRKDVIKEIMNGMINIVNGLYKKGNDGQISIYLNIINELVKSIAKVINDEEEYYHYAASAREILALNLDYNITNEEIYKILLNTYIKLYKLKAELDRERKIDNFKVKRLK